MKSKSIAIILLNWNNSNYTIDCIKSLKKTTYINKKIIVVDNASTDDEILFIYPAWSDPNILIK